MAFKRRLSGAWVDPTAIKRRSAGAWVTPTAIYRRLSGAWVLVWPSNVLVSPSSIDRTGLRSKTATTTMSDTLSISGGSGSYTTAFQSGAAGMTVSGTGATRTLTASCSAGTTDVTRSGVLRISDAADASKFYDLSFSYVFQGQL